MLDLRYFKCQVCGEDMWHMGYKGTDLSEQKRIDIIHKREKRQLEIKESNPEYKMMEDVDPNRDEHIYWCRFCGTICVTNKWDPVSITDFKAPRLLGEDVWEARDSSIGKG